MENKIDSENLNEITNENLHVKGINSKYLIDKIINKDYNDFISNLDKINDISQLEDEQIIKLRDKLKEIDVKLKEKAKPKTITISVEAHNIIKEYCSKLNESIGEWSEKILVDNIKCNNRKFLSIIEMKESIDEINIKPNIVLIDSLKVVIGDKGYECGVMECYDIEDFLRKVNGKTVYLYSIAHRDEGINMCSSANLRIRYFTI